MEYLTVLGIVFVTFAISFALINLRHIVVKQEFRGTCASSNPALKDKIGSCPSCAENPDAKCENEHEHGHEHSFYRELEVD